MRLPLSGTRVRIPPSPLQMHGWNELKKQHLNKLMYIKEKNMHQLIFMLTL